MTVIVCVDKNLGMLFNSRRLSRDREVIDRIISICNGRLLRINHFSANLFGDYALVSESFLEEANFDDFCFVENVDLSGYSDKIDKIIIYNWNRSYPADLFLGVNLNDFTLVRSVEFAGNSHDRITESIYVK